MCCLITLLVAHLLFDWEVHVVERNVVFDLDDRVSAQLSGCNEVIECGVEHHEFVDLCAIKDRQTPAVDAIARLFEPPQAKHSQNGAFGIGFVS